jgi:2-oxoisovalerate dehydrogenase E1 component alpha subunit
MMKNVNISNFLPLSSSGYFSCTPTQRVLLITPSHRRYLTTTSLNHNLLFASNHYYTNKNIYKRRPLNQLLLPTNVRIKLLSTNTNNIPITKSLSLDIPSTSTTNRRPMFQLMDEHGADRDDITTKYPDISQVNAIALYQVMVRLQTMDKVFFDAQRQGRLSFYMESRGEESVCIGSASALDPADVIFAQYREQGVLMWRGFPLQSFADQCVGNKDDLGKGRQMPVHYGSRELNYQTISSPLATKIPQASGAAYAIKLEEKGPPTKRCVACYFGDGAASEGDFHAGLNFASTLSCPVLFLCRNNGYAISTPVSEQYRGDGIVSRAPGYGMASLRVDGNDVWAVREATKEARLFATRECRPVLIEFMTYRQGHHSTSDDSTRYRSIDEIDDWRIKKHPITRLYNFMMSKSWWSDQEEEILRDTEKRDVLEALSRAEKKGMRNPEESLFEDVLDVPSPNLISQRDELREHLKIYDKEYNKDH